MTNFPDIASAITTAVEPFMSDVYSLLLFVGGAVIGACLGIGVILGWKQGL